MIHVDCPSCKAPYELDERRLPAGGMQMRCPKCGTSFPVRPPGLVHAPRAPTTAPRADRTPPPPRPRTPTLAGSSPAAPIAPAVEQATDGLDELDLPTPKRRPSTVHDLDDLDFPIPAHPSQSTPLDVFDLPPPRGAGLMLDGLDELDRPRAFNPATKLEGSSTAQRPGRGEAAPIVDLPAPKATAGAKPGEDISAPAPPFSEIDLPAPKQIERRSEAIAWDDVELDLPEQLLADLPPARATTEPPARPSGAFESAGSDAAPFRVSAPDAQLEGRVSLGPEARPPSSAPDPVSGRGALEAPGDPGRDDPAEHALGAFPGIGERVDDADPKREPRARPRIARPLVVSIALLALLAAGGALRFTPYGPFGLYLVEERLPSAGTETDAKRVIERAEARAASDTYADARSALRELAAARRVAGLNRSLLVRSLVHEALFQARFGEDADGAARAARIFERLDARAALVPDMAVARAAEELARQAPTASAAAEARRVAPNDAYVELLVGEGALLRGAGDEAREAFRAALSEGAGARARWGLARALRLLGDEGWEAAVDATLAESPDHGSALAAKAELMLERGLAEDAAALASRAIGGPHGATTGAAGERSFALAVLGRAEEARSRGGSARRAYDRALALDPARTEALVGVGRVLLREGQPREALSRFEAAIEALERPSSPGRTALLRGARLGRAEALLGAGRTADARAALDSLATGGDDWAVALLRGRVLIALGETEQGAAELRRAVELAPERIEPYLALAEHWRANDRAAQAADVLQEARAHVAPGVELHRMLGESLLRSNRLPAAREELRRALALDPEDVGALFGLAAIARSSGRLDEAERLLGRLAKLDGSHPDLLLEKASIYEARGRSRRACVLLERALERRPGNAEIALRLAGAQVAAGELEAAEKTLVGILEAESPPAIAFYYHGRVALDGGDFAAAVSRFGRAVALDPERADFHVHLAWARLEAGDLAGAQKDVAASLKLDSGLGDAYWVRARIELVEGELRDAVDDAERALAENPRRTEAHAVRAGALEQLNRRADAIEAYRAALEHHADVGEWWYRLGRLLFDSRDRKQALEAVTRATELGDARSSPPGWLADAHRVRADVHRLGREWPSAKRHYERALALTPSTSREAAYLERRLRELQRRR